MARARYTRQLSALVTDSTKDLIERLEETFMVTQSDIVRTALDIALPDIERHLTENGQRREPWITGDGRSATGSPIEPVFRSGE